MDKAEIIRLGAIIRGFGNWLKDTMDKNLYKPYPMPDDTKIALENGIKDIINQIINNGDEVAFKAIEPLYLLKDRIGQFYFDYTVWLLKDAPATDDIMQEWNINHPESNLRFGGFDYSEDHAYLSFLSNIEGEIRLLSNFLQSREPEEELKTSKSKAGRKRSEFKDFIKPSYKDKADDIVRMLRSELDGIKGKAVAIVLIAAIKNGYIVKPEKSSFDREFGNHIDKDTYSRYMREEQEPDLWRSNEVKVMQSKLKLKPE